MGTFEGKHQCNITTVPQERVKFCHSRHGKPNQTKLGFMVATAKSLSVCFSFGH